MTSTKCKGFRTTYKETSICTRILHDELQRSLLMFRNVVVACLLQDILFRAGIEKVTPHVEPRTVPSYISSDPEILPSEQVTSYKTHTI